MTYFVGIDVGGTFTDGVVMNREGQITIVKTLSTHDNPSRGLFNCLEQAAGRLGMGLADFLSCVERLTYGTTAATNSLVEGRGAPAGLLTTRGFGSTLPLARIGREYLAFDVQFDPAPELLPPTRIREITERVDCQGQVLAPLRPEQARQAIKELREAGATSLAVCLLWSFANDCHEQAIASMLEEEFPDLPFSLSSRVAPLIGEYERTATTVMNAQLVPPMQKHLRQLQEELATRGYRRPLLIMQSVGGVIPYEDALQRPITLINSGPAGGVLAGQLVARWLGYPNAICIDMGGTTFDVSLLVNGQYVTSTVSRVCGHSVMVPMIDIRSIGAGGGSIAWLDMGRRLKVGPQSAGADPGPVCYGRGGKQPTVTDANLILGYLNGENFLGGRLALDEVTARECLAAEISVPLGLGLEEAAAGILHIVETSMADAIKEITISRGYDPREFALFAFGGAAPLHAGVLARELGIKTVVITPFATVQSAFGILSADVVHTFFVTDVMPLNDHQRINRHLAKMEEQGKKLLQAEGFKKEEMEVRIHAEMRFRGQFHELSVPVPWRRLEEKNLAELAELFLRQYEAVYGQEAANRAVGAELVNLRMEVVGLTVKPELQERPPFGGAVQAQGWRSAIFLETGGQSNCPIYRGEDLPVGASLDGPAVVEYEGTTAVLRPGQTGHVDRYQNLIIRLPGKGVA